MNAAKEIEHLPAASQPAASSTTVADLAATAQRRADWMRLITRWHWISSALCLVGMLFFALTGITLVHAERLESRAATTTSREAAVPGDVMQALNLPSPPADNTVPPALVRWLDQTWHIPVVPKAVEWGPDELFLDLKRPGVDAAVTIDLRQAVARYEAVDRGWVAYFNELHRGRNAGPVWAGFLTVFGVVCVIFSLTGLLLLQMHARARWSVWPVTGLGLLAPLLLILLFIH